MPQSGIGWQSWSTETFRRAAGDRRLVLLFITTEWSLGSTRMLRTVYTDPRVIDVVARRFVPVHVDADARPDIADRYSLEGWPSTLLLTIDGEILNGVTFAEADSLAGLLERTADLYAADAGTIEARASKAREARQRGRAAGAAASQPAVPSAIAEALLATADTAPHGYLDDARCLHGDALLFLLRYGLSAGDARAVDRVRWNVDSMLDGGLFDPVEGVSRCGWADGAEPLAERDAMTQASVLRALSEGFDSIDDARWHELTAGLAACIRERWLPNGKSAIRRPAFTDAVADLSGAALLAAAALDDHALARQALAALEDSALATYRPGQGVAHSTEPGAPRLLVDHVAVIRTLLDTHELTGELPYSMLAEELGWFVLRHYADTGAGAFADRAGQADPSHDPGRLSEPFHPFRANALAAHVLARLSKTSGEAEFAEAAATAFAWCAARWREQGLDAASCGIAALDLIDWRLSSPSGGGRHTIR